MAVPSRWTTALSRCKAYVTSFESARKDALRAAEDRKKKFDARLARQVKVCEGVGYDIKRKRPDNAAIRKKAEDAMKSDSALKTFDQDIEKLEKRMLVGKDPLRKELDAFEKLLDGPEAKGSNGKGLGVAADVLKAHKAGLEYLETIRAKYSL